MRIIEVAGPSHREDGAPGYILSALNRLKGVRADRRTVLHPPDTWGDWDGTLDIDWAADAFPGLPEFIPPKDHPSIVFNSDTHWSSKSYQYRLDHSRRFETVYCAQRDAVMRFETEGVKASWMPHAAEHTCYTPAMKSYNLGMRFALPADPEAFLPRMVFRVPRYDWSFIGFMNTDRRIFALRDLMDEFPNYYSYSGLFFEDVARVYNDSKVVFNVSVNGDLNMRSFEALACRACLLTDRQQGMEEAGFKDGVNCMIWETLEESMDKMDYLLHHEGERERLADAGWRLCLSRHTYLHRARTLVDEFARLKDNRIAQPVHS